MTTEQARRVLDAVRCGEASGISMDTITDALIALGDLPNPLQSVAQFVQEDTEQ